MSWSTGGPCPREFDVEIQGMRFKSKTVRGIFEAYVNTMTLHDQMLPLDWEDLVWRALKQAYPEHIHKTGKPASPGVSVASAYAFSRFIMKRMLNRSLVAPDEAKARAAVCFRCPLKEPVLGCSVCKQALSLVVSPPEPVEAPPGCGACGCYLPLKVWIPKSQLGDMGEFPYWEECWMRDQSRDIV